MPVTAMIVSLGMFVMIATSVYFLILLLKARMIHRTLREAISRDSAVAEGLIERLERGDQLRAEMGGDDRNGLVLVAIGVALGGFALIVNEPEWLRYQLGAALFPILVGLALLGRHFWMRRKRHDIATG